MTFFIRLIPRRSLREVRSSPSVLLGLAVLSGCTVGPTFEPPSAAAPLRWESDAAGTAAVERAWWRVFDDSVLNELVERAREENPDVRIAMLHVAQSRMQRRFVAGASAPSLAASGSYQRQRQSEHGAGTRMIDVLGPPGDRDAIIDALSEPYDVFEAGFDAAWELDVWGRVRRAIEAADASVEAVAADFQAMQLSVTAETVRTYLELRGVDEQLAITNDDVAAAESALQLAELRAAGGLVTQLDVVSQRARLADARARAPQLAQRRTQLANALATLLGEAPGALEERLAAAPAAAALPPQIGIGVASDVVRRRPDIRAAEARLHAATAEIGVAIADLYPRFTLTGGLLMQSLDAADLSEWGARQWSVGPALSIPLFDGGRRRAMVELRDLQQQEAAVSYQRTVLRAWREIDDALSAYAAEQSRNRELAAGVEASLEAYEIARIRYEHGLVNFLIPLDAQRTLLNARRAHSESSTALRTQLVALYKALGA